MSAQRRRFVAVLALLTIVLAGCQVGPSAASGRPVLVSGPSPYAACALDVAGGVKFVGGEVETWLAANPKDEKNLVGVWMADRWSDGAGAGVVAATSFDGGKTWTQTPLAFNGCAEHGLTQHGRAGDPWVSIGPDGRVYASALIVNKSTRTFAIGVTTSGDGGRTWSDYHLLQSVTRGDTKAGVDKESVTADPTRPGTAYAVWMWETSGPDQMPSGQAAFARTTDGGKSWSEPRVIFKAAQSEVASGSLILVDARTGTLYHFFRWINILGGNMPLQNSIGLQTSTDGGETWSNAAKVITVNRRNVTHPNLKEPVRTFGELPMPALSPATGRLYVAWEQSGGDDSVDVVVASSTDGGQTWSGPAVVGTGFRPTVAVNSQGQVGISYYRFSSRGEGLLVPTELVLAVYDADLKERREFAVTAPFDLNGAPKGPGAFLGDYLGLAGVRDRFHLFYVTSGADAQNPTDVYAASVKP